MTGENCFSTEGPTYFELFPGTVRYAIEVLAELSDQDFAAAVRAGKVALAAKVIGCKSRELIRLAREARGCHSGPSCPYCRDER